MARTPEEIEKLLDRVEGLLRSVDDANDRFDRGQWKERHEADFGPLEENLKKLNGDDFDIYNASYDEYNDGYKDIGEEAYTAKLVENIKNVFNRIWPDATEEEKAEAADAVAEEVTNTDTDADVTKVETTDPEVAEAITDEVKDEVPSDENIKETLEQHPGREGKKFWDNPSESGGRHGKVGISDEDAKEAPDKVKDEVKDEELDEKAAHEKELEEFRNTVAKERDRYTRK